MAKSFHIMHPTRWGTSIPIPVTFYLSPELAADEETTAVDIARLLHDDLVLAIEHHRAHLHEHEAA